MDDSQYFAVPLNSYGSSACSPLSEQTGLRIAAPAIIDLSRRSTFPLCGTLRFSARFLATLGDDPIEATVVVVVNTETNTPLSFNLRPDKEPVKNDQPAAAIDPSDFAEDDVRENYFNVDLKTFSPQLEAALKPGRHAIYAVLRTFKSNTVQVQVVADGGTRGE